MNAKHVKRKVPWFCAVVVAALAVLALLRTMPDEPDEPNATTAVDITPAARQAIAAAAARIARQSMDEPQPAAVVAARGTGSRDAQLPRRGASSATPPDGYSITKFKGRMATAPLGSSGDARGARRFPAEVPRDGGPAWLESHSIDSLLAQAAAGRGWTYAWMKMQDDARRVDLQEALRGTGAAIVGSAGKLLRVRLPADEPSLATIAELPGVAGLGAMPAQAKLAAFDQAVSAGPANEPIPVFVTLMDDDPDGRWGRELETLGAVVGGYDASIRVYSANVTEGVAKALAETDFVLAVEPIRVVEAAHDTAVPAMGADALRVHGGSPGIFTGTTGAAVSVGVMDTGLNVNHPDIAEGRTSICGANLVW